MRAVAVLALLILAATAHIQTRGDGSNVMHPARGYDTWNGFGRNINESVVISQAAVLKDLNTKGGNYDYFILDEGWSHTSDQSTWVLNQQSIPIPSPERFPSSLATGGLGPLASNLKNNYGLDLGVWLIKGIPKQAVDLNLPIPGPDGKPTNLTAGDILYNDKRVCGWHTDVYSIDMSKPGAQDYYDGVFGLYASWGVRYFKVDCIFGKNYDKAEIVGVQSGVSAAQALVNDKIVLSLSPGVNATPALAQTINGYTNSYRMTQDLWNCFAGNKGWGDCVIFDGTKALQFQTLIGDASTSKWADQRPSFPDMDMVPVGGFRLPASGTKKWIPLDTNTTRFCLLLWSFVKSPVILTGDLTMNITNETYSLLGNLEVAAMHRNSKNPRSIRWDSPPAGKVGQGIWVAENPIISNARYVAVFAFNATLGPNDGPQPIPWSSPTVQVSIPVDKLGLTYTGPLQVTDLLDDRWVVGANITSSSITIPVAVNDARLLLIMPGKNPNV